MLDARVPHVGEIHVAHVGQDDGAACASRAAQDGTDNRVAGEGRENDRPLRADLLQQEVDHRVRSAVHAAERGEGGVHDDLVAALQSNSIQCAAQIVDGSLGAGCGVHVCSPSGMNLTGNGQFVEKDLVLRQHGRHGLRRDAAGLRHLVAAFLEGRGSGKVADPVVGISRHERVRER